MIVWNQKIRKSEDVIKAVIDGLYKENINTDGVVDVFCDGASKEQGCVLKIFDKFNPNLDICFWVYMPNERKTNNEINVICGRHINCTDSNMWDGDNLEYHTIKDNNARQMHNLTRDFIMDEIKANFNKTHDIPQL